jgi:hypothetical protein
VWKKSEVIEEILAHIDEGKTGKWEYGTGSFAESGHLKGWSYFLTIYKNGKIVLDSPIRNEKYELITKKQKYNWKEEFSQIGKEFEKRRKQRIEATKPIKVKAYSYIRNEKEIKISVGRRKKPRKKIKYKKL